jgi:nicotinate-nucleotide--dimethylbenzimidazole phosphoribosyltransferase
LVPNIVERCARIPELHVDVMQKARNRLDDLTKPLGSLGVLEDVIAHLAAMTGQVIPSFHKPVALMFAADHGVSEQGVSAYGSQVTEEMVVNMCMGSAVSSVLSRAQNVTLKVVDVGVRSRVRHPNVIVRKVAPGTKNFASEPAMTLEQAYQAVEIGFDIAEESIRAGADIAVIGEMGIGNTTASTAMIASLLRLPVDQLVGVGTGISEDRKRTKTELITRALQLHQPNSDDPWDVLTKVGGFEIGAMAGAFIACASHRVPVILDGVITSTAALLANRINPHVRNYLIASHRSSEPAHQYVLKELGLSPLVEWGMHLGEGSGALFVLPVIQNACKVMAETATFEDARVSNPHKATSGVQPLPSKPEAETLKSPVVRDFDDAEREAVYKVILARRDIRSFLTEPIPDDVLERILIAAHHAPSVGYMQPWNFILIRDRERLKQIQRVVERERVRASENYQDLKQEYYLRLKVEGLLQAPITICVTNDSSRGGPHVLGRNTIPETDLMSTSCAIENMWLAARAEGVGMGWVSIYQKEDIRQILNIPDHIDPVALLSIGYTAHFPEIPLLERVGWRNRLDLQTLIYHDFWGNREESKE